jgi:hypothetical protein
MTTKLAIAINLDQLRALAQEYIIAMGGDGGNDIMERLTLSSFMEWLKKRQETTHGKKPNHTTNRTVSRSNIGPTGIVPRSG